MQLCRNHAASRRAPETIGSSAGTHENANEHQNLVATLPVFARQFERSLVDFVVGSIAAFFLEGCIPFYGQTARATNPPIKKPSAAIVLDAAFEGEQSVAPLSTSGASPSSSPRNRMHPFWSTGLNLSYELFERRARRSHCSLPMRVPYGWNRQPAQIRAKSRRRQAPIQFLKIESYLSKPRDHPTSTQSVEANGRKSATLAKVERRKPMMIERFELSVN